MKKFLIAAWALLLTVALAGCGADDKPRNDVGNFYENYTATELDNGDLQITAEAHVDDVLALVYFNAAEDTNVDVYLDVKDGWGLATLFYVYSDEDGEHELLLWENNAKAELKKVVELDTSLELPAGESRLELRTENGTELEFEMRLSNVEGVDYAMFSPEEEAAWYAMLEALDKPFEPLKGNFYNDFVSEHCDNGDYKVSAEAHIEDELTLVYLNAAEVETLGMELKVNKSRGDFTLYYLQADGTEVPLAGYTGEGEEITKPTSWELPLTLAAGESRLAWRAEEGAALEFELLLSNCDGVNISMTSPKEEADWDEMADALDKQFEPLKDLKNGITVSGTQGSDSVQFTAMNKELTADEPTLLLSCAPEKDYQMTIMAALWDLSGDVQLYYVQPGGVDELLWDSRTPAEGEQPQRWQNLWGYILPEEVDPAEILTIDLTLNLLPGEGRLEWRTVEGASFIITIYMDNFMGLNAVSLGI